MPQQPPRVYALLDPSDVTADRSGATFGEVLAALEAGMSDRELFYLAFHRWRCLSVRAEREHVPGARVLPFQPLPTTAVCVHRDQFRADDDGA